MSQINVYLGVLKETKLTKFIYTRASSGYTFISMDAMSAHSIGVAIFYLTTDHFLVEAFQVHGVNIVSFQMTSRDRRWYILG